ASAPSIAWSASSHAVNGDLRENSLCPMPTIATLRYTASAPGRRSPILRPAQRKTRAPFGTGEFVGWRPTPTTVADDLPGPHGFGRSPIFRPEGPAHYPRESCAESPLRHDRAANDRNRLTVPFGARERPVDVRQREFVRDDLADWQLFAVGNDEVQHPRHRRRPIHHRADHAFA